MKETIEKIFERGGVRYFVNVRYFGKPSEAHDQAVRAKGCAQLSSNCPECVRSD